MTSALPAEPSVRQLQRGLETHRDVVAPFKKIG